MTRTTTRRAARPATHIRARRRGYVMLMVLLLLLVSSAAVVSLARSSLARVAAAGAAREDVQRRWGTRSIRDAALPVADALLADAPSRRFDVTLGGLSFAVRLDDEQAKPNVNALLGWVGRARAGESLKALLADATPRLAPELGRRDASDGRASRDAARRAAEDEQDGDDEATAVTDGIAVTIGSLGQLFPGSTAADLRGDDGVAGRVTLWGNGMLNFRTASRAALIEACRGELSPRQVDRLIAIRGASRDTGLDEFLATVGVKNPNFNPLQRRLIGDSWCHSAWITVRTPRGRVYDSLLVRDATSTSHPIVSTFDFAP